MLPKEQSKPDVFNLSVCGAYPNGLIKVMDLTLYKEKKILKKKA